MENKFVKLSELVNSTMTITKVWPPKWKVWDQLNKKMLVSEIPEKGYRKLYGVETDKGKLDLGSGQIGSLLEAVFDDGRADLNGVTFKVKSNGKQGMEIRYFFDAVGEEEVLNIPDPIDIPEDW